MISYSHHSIRVVFSYLIREALHVQVSLRPWEVVRVHQTSSSFSSQFWPFSDWIASMNELSTLCFLPKLSCLLTWFLQWSVSSLLRFVFCVCRRHLVSQSNAYVLQFLRRAVCTYSIPLCWKSLQVKLRDLGFGAWRSLSFVGIQLSPWLHASLVSTSFVSRYPSTFCKLAQVSEKHQRPFHACTYQDAQGSIAS